MAADFRASAAGHRFVPQPDTPDPRLRDSPSAKTGRAVAIMIACHPKPVRLCQQFCQQRARRIRQTPGAGAIMKTVPQRGDEARARQANRIPQPLQRLLAVVRGQKPPLFREG
jgi:hypothetical protein